MGPFRGQGPPRASAEGTGLVVCVRVPASPATPRGAHGKNDAAVSLAK